MTFSDHGNCERSRTEPVVWVQRLILFESLEPLREIRTVELHPGINVIWGMEGELDGGNFQPGHGVGKTTFCRLLRYCLGEDFFGQRHAAREIRYSFRDGYVAADVRVANQAWSVLRPLGENHRLSYAMSNSSIPDLIRDKPKSSFLTFKLYLAEACLTGVQCAAVLTGGDSIKWDHILAMCARDQEARYDRFWNWRHSRSDSGTPKFRQPKADASLCVRSLMQLLPDGETAKRVSVQTLSDDLDRIERAILEKQAEPSFHVRQLRRELEQALGAAQAANAPLDANDLFGLPRLVAKRIEQLEVIRREADAAQPSLDRQISLAAASLLEPAELQAEEAAAAELTDLGTTTLLRGIEELRNSLREISEVENSRCRYGNILIGNCEYAKHELANLNRDLRELQKRDVPEVVKREQFSSALLERTKRRGEILQGLRERLDQLTRRRNEIADSRFRAGKTIDDLNDSLQRLEEWDGILNGRVPNSEVAELVEKRTVVAAKLEDAKSALKRSMAEQNERARVLRQTFESLVKRTLTGEFKGQVEVSDDGLVFQIYRGESLSGEAYDTLSILLADLALLLMGANGTAQHPGLLIHDSPREADLGARIYGRFLSVVAELASETANDGIALFQYIVTTTTPPPKPLQARSATSLRLGGDNGLLFMRQLQPPPENATRLLFDLSEPEDGVDLTEDQT